MIRGIPPPLWKDKSGFKRRWKPRTEQKLLGKGPGVEGSGGKRGWGELGERGVGEPMEVRKQNYKGQAPSGEGE